MGLTLILPVLPFYAERYGATPFVVGLLVTSFAACQLVASPILGKISDRVGRRPVLIVSQIGTCAGFIVLALSNTLWMVFLARIIDGVTAGNLSIAQAYIADVTAPEDRAKSFGIVGIAFGIGFLIGPAIAGYLSQFSYHYPMVGAAVLSATSVMVTYLLLPSSTPRPATDAALPGGRRLGVLEWKQYAQYFRRPVLARRLLLFLSFVFAFSIFTSGFALFAERRFTWQGHPFGPREVGYVFAYIGFLGIILQGKLLGPLVKRFGEGNLIVAGFLTAGASYVFLGVAHGLAVLVASATLGAFGNGVLRPAITGQVTRAADVHEQGVVLGLTQSIASMSLIVAPMLGNALIEHRMLRTWALVATAAVVLGFVAGLGDRARPAATG